MKHIKNIYNEIAMFKGFIHKFNRNEKYIYCNIILLYFLIIIYFIFFK